MGPEFSGVHQADVLDVRDARLPPQLQHLSYLFHSSYVSTRIRTALGILDEISTRSDGKDKTIVFVRFMNSARNTVYLKLSLPHCSPSSKGPCKHCIAFSKHVAPLMSSVRRSVLSPALLFDLFLT